MIIKNIGVDIDRNTIIEKFYKAPQERKCVHLCKETNFDTGFIAYEDGVFLPEGTYVILKEKGKEDKIGRIFHFYMSYNKEANKVAIVDVHYDMDSSKNRLCMNDKLIIGFISKSMAGINCNKDKFLQVISYEETEDDKWKFVRVEYGNPNVKMFYMYGWRYWDGRIYTEKDLSSGIITCLKEIHCSINAYEDIYTSDKQTNIEHKIPPSVRFVPYETELLMVYIILLCVTFIFEGKYMIWTVLTLFFIIIRRDMRNKYNG